MIHFHGSCLTGAVPDIKEIMQKNMVFPSVLYNMLLSCNFTYCVANGTAIQKIRHVHSVVLRTFIYNILRIALLLF